MKNSTQLLKWMLEDVRKETILGICKLGKEQLFAEPVKGEYPVGAYLMHLSECDIHWYEVLSGENVSDDIKAECCFDKWFDPSGESEPPATAPEVETYAGLLSKTRAMILNYLDPLSDDDLEGKVIMKSRKRDIEISRKWIVYHLIEHEAHHKGQMFMLIRMAGWRNEYKTEDRKSVWWQK